MLCASPYPIFADPVSSTTPPQKYAFATVDPQETRQSRMPPPKKIEADWDLSVTMFSMATLNRSLVGEERKLRSKCGPILQHLQGI